MEEGRGTRRSKIKCRCGAVPAACRGGAENKKILKGVITTLLSVAPEKEDLVPGCREAGGPERVAIVWHRKFMRGEDFCFHRRQQQNEMKKILEPALLHRKYF